MTVPDTDKLPLAAVIMAKRPDPGAVKTRMISPDLPAATVAEIAEAMLRCVVHRLSCFQEIFLAVTPDGCGPALADRLGVANAACLDQGAGDLGQRLDRIWNLVGTRRPIAFFGMDSPDVPPRALRAIPNALQEADLAIGPTPDGGYWTLSASRYCPQVFTGIDWGCESVYDQTCHRAQDAGLKLERLPEWHDVDDSGDLHALRRRLHQVTRAGGEADTDLIRLATSLQAIVHRPETPEANLP